MTDKTYNLVDPNTGSYIPVDMVDNGDGSFSPKISASVSGAAYAPIGSHSSGATI